MRIILVPRPGTLCSVEGPRPSGAALSENRERKAGGSERDDAPTRADGERRVKLLGARIACVVGLLLGAGGIVAALFGGVTNISAGALGAALGILGYFLGSSRLATATVFLCVAAIFFGLAASQGLIPVVDAPGPSLLGAQPSVE